MNEQREESPQLKLKDLKNDQEIKLTLEKGTPIASGNSQYGEWNLWLASVENFSIVYEGRGSATKVVNNYSGKVTIFPSEKTHEQWVEICNGNDNVEISIKKVLGDSNGRPFYKYETTKLSEGEVSNSSSDLTDGETKLVGDFKSLRAEGVPISLSDILNVVTNESDKYGDISEDRAKELYKKILL